MEEEFKKYVSQFDMKKNFINLKYTHSIRVKEISINLAKSLNLNKDDINLAAYIGLLHDYGRFVQLKKFNSFNDIKTFDHGDIGAIILFDNKEIEKYNVSKKDYEVIKKAIINHNKLTIENNLTERELLFAKLIRDADKIDILNIRLQNIIKGDSDNSIISEEVIKNFNNNTSIDNHYLKTNNDKIIMVLGLFFDLYYPYTLKYIVKNKIMERFQEKYNNEIFKPYFNKIKKYIDERIEQEC